MGPFLLRNALRRTRYQLGDECDGFLAAALGGRSPEVAAEALVNGTTLASAEARKALLELDDLTSQLLRFVSKSH